LVFLPITVYSLMRGPFKRVFLSGFLTSLSLLVSNTFTLSVMLRSEQVHIWSDHHKFLLGPFIRCWLLLLR
jgi:hypothetical protein